MAFFYELGVMWKKAIVVYYKVGSSTGLKEPQKIRKRQLVFGKGIELRSYRIRCVCANHHWASVFGSRIE